MTVWASTCMRVTKHTRRSVSSVPFRGCFGLTAELLATTAVRSSLLRPSEPFSTPATEPLPTPERSEFSVSRLRLPGGTPQAASAQAPSQDR